MNKVILMGRLTSDPELKQTPNGVSVTRFRVAVARRFKSEGQPEADFITCSAWRQTAEFITKWFNKGSMIALVGSIQTRTWQDNEGKNQYATEVQVDEAYFTGSKNEGTTPTQTAAAPAQNEFDGFIVDVDNEGDLPF